MKKTLKTIVTIVLLISLSGCTKNGTGPLSNQSILSDDPVSTFSYDSTHSTDPGDSGKDSQSTVSYPPITQDNLIPLYFDLLDYMRSQSLGANFATATNERTRVTQMISASWGQIDSTTRNTLTQMAQLAQTIKPDFAGLSQAQKNEKTASWKRIVLSPQWLYAPLANPKTYSDSGISFCCPQDWSWWSVPYGGVNYLFVFKDGAQTYSYEQIGNMTTCPAGCLSTITSTSGYTPVQLVDELANSVTGAAPDMKTIQSFDTVLGSVRVMNGRFPGQAEEKFIWLVVIPKDGQYIFCRMSGPVSQADMLVPAFYNMLNTLNWSTTPAGGGGSGGASAAFDTAWSRVSTAIVANIWAK